MKRCPACGELVLDDATMCPHPECGKPIPSDTPSAGSSLRAARGIPRPPPPGPILRQSTPPPLPRTVSKPLPAAREGGEETQSSPTSPGGANWNSRRAFAGVAVILLALALGWVYYASSAASRGEPDAQTAIENAPQDPGVPQRIGAPQDSARAATPTASVPPSQPATPANGAARPSEPASAAKSPPRQDEAKAAAVPADVVFLFDVGPSLEGSCDLMKRSCVANAARLRAQALDVRFAVIPFGEEVERRASPKFPGPRTRPR